ncbi:MAG TPA: hypothetical protein VFZ34_30920 [Blastocatellia bacterium]|nr:hypothetical protein [Blastocatellia bacterium]
MKPTLSKIAFLLVCTGLLPVSAFAQTNNTNSATPKRLLGLVNEFTIKPGMMTAFLQWAEKESKPLYVRAGIKTGYFFTNLYDTADRNVVTLIEMHESFAAIRARHEAFNKNNSKEELDAWSAKSREFIVGIRTYIVETLPELSWTNPKMKNLPLYYMVTERHIAPFRGRDYEAYLKNDWLPLVKKAESNGTLVSRLRYGGESGHYFVFGSVHDLTELDQPSKITQAAGGAEAVAKMQQKLIGIVQRSEQRVLRLRPEISIIPAPTTAAK